MSCTMGARNPRRAASPPAPSELALRGQKLPVTPASKIARKARTSWGDLGGKTVQNARNPAGGADVARTARRGARRARIMHGWAILARPAARLAGKALPAPVSELPQRPGTGRNRIAGSPPPAIVYAGV